MKRFLALIICISLLLSNWIAFPVTADVEVMPKQREEKIIPDDMPYAPNRVIVKLKTAKMGYKSRQPSALPFPDLGIDVQESRVINPSSTSTESVKNASVGESENYTQNTMYVVTLKESGKDAVQNAVATLNKNSSVEYAVPDMKLKLCDTTPNDEKYSGEAGEAMYAIKAPQAWDITTGSKKVVVGILDSGIDGKHKDLKDNLWTNPNPNKNGYKNDLYGYDFVERKGGIPTDPHGHGTHVSGIIGAKGNNGIGVCGINWNVQLVNLRIADEDGLVDTSAAVEAINYAKNIGISIINGSWGGYSYYEYYKPLEEAIKSFKGLYVAASGNDGICIDTTPLYPAAFSLSNIITVGAANAYGYRPEMTNGYSAGFSNYSTTLVDLYAPGSDILSTTPGNKYEKMSGTSMAAPMVTGVVALVKAKHPTYTAAQIKKAILDGAVKNNDDLLDEAANGAVLNAYGALIDTKPTPESIKTIRVNEIEVEANQSLCLYANILPVEANQKVIWSCDNTDVVKINSDGIYTALKEGTATITVTSADNPSVTKAIPITVTPAVSQVANFKDKNFKAVVVRWLNIGVQFNGYRHIDSKLYLSETESITGLDFRGADIKSLDDLQYLSNLDHLTIKSNVLKGDLDFTNLKKLEKLRVSSEYFGMGWRYYYYTDGQYEYDVNSVKAIIGGHPIEASVSGDAFMDIDWLNNENLNGGNVTVFYKEFHKPVYATLNGEKLEAFDPDISTYYIDCDKPSKIKVVIQPQVKIGSVSLFQKITEQLNKLDPVHYWYYKWTDGYKLNDSDVFQITDDKPVCKYDLARLKTSQKCTYKLSTSIYTYNGEAKKPSVTVKYYNGKTLKKDTDYTVKYATGRKNVGKYSVKITFKGKYNGTKTLYFSIIPKAPSKITVSKGTAGIKANWAKVSGATGYKVYLYKGSKLVSSKVLSSKNLSHTFKKLSPSTAYTVKVKAYKTVGGTKYYSNAKAYATATRPKTPTITSLKGGTRSVTVKWSNVSGESGYQLYYSTSRSGTYKRAATLKANDIDTVVKNLTRGKTYYFKVRAYKKTSNGNVYSSWSTVKYVKAK